MRETVDGSAARRPTASTADGHNEAGAERVSLPAVRAAAGLVGLAPRWAR